MVFLILELLTGCHYQKHLMNKAKQIIEARVYALTDLNMISENKRLILSRGRLISNSEYRDYKQFLIDYFKLTNKEPMIKGSFRASLVIHTYKDLTNLIKPIFDALEGAEVIENDRHLTGFDEFEKVTLKKGQPDSFYVSVWGV